MHIYIQYTLHKTPVHVHTSINTFNRWRSNMITTDKSGADTPHPAPAPAPVPVLPVACMNTLIALCTYTACTPGWYRNWVSIDGCSMVCINLTCMSYPAVAVTVTLCGTGTVSPPFMPTPSSTLREIPEQYSPSIQAAAFSV